MTTASTINKQEIIAATDQCVMCGLCLPHCPTYAVAKTETESPRGRIALVRALYEGKLEASKTINTHLEHCLTCMSCESVCPANVDYETIIDAGRAATNSENSASKQMHQSFLLFFLSNPNARKLAKTLIRTLQTFGLINLFTKFRLFKLLPDSSYISTNENAHSTNADTAMPRVLIVNTCAGDLTNDQTVKAAKNLLAKLGCKILEGTQTLCCGALHQHSGNLNAANELRNKFIHDCLSKTPDYIVSLATGCGAQIKRYPQLDDSPDAKELASKLVDINEFILQLANNHALPFKPLASKVLLHKPCTQQQVNSDPKTMENLLRLIPDIKVIEFEDQQSCCGAGGMNTLNHHELANQLIENKIQEIADTRSSYLVSGNIGCAFHFQAQLRSKNIPTQVYHPITLLAQQMV